MKIALLSDTHDHVENTLRAVEIIKEKKVDRVIHTGDLCSPFMIQAFAGFQFDLVKGNNDADVTRIMKNMEENQRFHDEFLYLEIEGIKMAFYHGTTKEITQALVNDNYDIVVSGHTHTKVEERQGDTLHINPGSVHGFSKGGSFAILTLPEKTIEFINLG